MRKTPILVVLCTYLFSNQICAQWAGASSNAGSSTISSTKNNLNNKDFKGRFTLGLGVGGTAYDMCYESTLPSGILYNYITSDPDPTGISFFLSGIQKTSFDRVWIGFESGLSAYSKTIDYTYFSNWSGTSYTDYHDVDILYFGAAIPIRFSFVEKKEVDVYAQASLGYGLIGNLYDEEYYGEFYGGAAVGARWTVLFAEVGYITTGYLRFGLCLPTVN